MLILRALVLGGLVLVHIVGAAFFFRRLYPGESRWLAFVVPEIVVIFLCNFVEHHIALTALRFVLPVTTFGAMAAITGPKAPWRVMRLPTFLFLSAFAFALGVRLMRPDLEDSNGKDGIYDVSLICHFLFGQTLPVESTWLPPLKLLDYYCLEHYGASVLIRWLGVDVGTGWNLCTALLSAYIYFFAGATAWHLGRGKLWITILATGLTACAVSGAAGYLWLTVPDLEPRNTINIVTLNERPNPPDSLLLRQLTPGSSKRAPELYPPGVGVWIGDFHSMNAGQFVICLAVLSLIELLRRKRTNWPWICLALAPFLMTTNCTWGLPMTVFLLLAGLLACARAKIVPRSRPFVLAVTAGLIALLEPMLSYFLQAPSPAINWVQRNEQTQWPEFMPQWWPVVLPGLALCWDWKRLPAATQIVLVMTPLAFAGVEVLNLGWRADMTGRFWTMIYCAAWITFLPEVARRKAQPFRVILAMVVLTSALSLAFWTTYSYHSLNRDEVGHLDGLGQFRTDLRKARILEVLSPLENQIIMPGRSGQENTTYPMFAALSHNRAYATWVVISDSVFYPNGVGESGRRLTQMEALYDGSASHPLYLLRQANVSAFVINPDDDIDPAVVGQLTKDLAPYYTYDDAYYISGDDIQKDFSNERPCAGVFIYHPEITTLLGEPPKP